MHTYGLKSKRLILYFSGLGERILLLQQSILETENFHQISLYKSVCFWDQNFTSSLSRVGRVPVGQKHSRTGRI
jgi:hypothetical protein